MYVKSRQNTEGQEWTWRGEDGMGEGGRVGSTWVGCSRSGGVWRPEWTVSGATSSVVSEMGQNSVHWGGVAINRSSCAG